MKKFINWLLHGNPSPIDEKTAGFIAWTYYFEDEFKRIYESMTDQERREFHQRVASLGISADDAAQALINYTD